MLLNYICGNPCAFACCKADVKIKVTTMLRMAPKRFVRQYKSALGAAVIRACSVALVNNDYSKLYSYSLLQVMCAD
jgi:hypothetical protein